MTRWVYTSGGDDGPDGPRASLPGDSSSKSHAKLATESSQSVDVEVKTTHSSGSGCVGLWSNEAAGGAFKPVLTGVALIAMFRRALPSSFAIWRQPPYEYEHDKLPIDILAGSDTFRRQLEVGVPLRAVVESWREDEETFARLRQPYLLY